MTTWVRPGAAALDLRSPNVASSDPRVGSARDNGTTTKVAGVLTGTNSASFSQLFFSFVPISVYAAVCVIVFLSLRRKYPRVYAPRTFLSSLEPYERSATLPSGWFNWIRTFYRIPDTDVLNQSSLDGFLFLRYLKVLCVICFVGCAITWPVLLPLHAYGGGGLKQLDRITFGNVRDPSWFYVHAFQAWIFFGFILYMVARECVYFINLRQAYLLSPFYANRLSSRTVLFTCVPQQILDEKKLRSVFGDVVKNVWIPRDTEDLDKLVKERNQTALRLEKAEIALIKKANIAWQRLAKNGHPDIEASVESRPDDHPREPDSSQSPGFSDSQVTSPTSTNDPSGLKTGYGLTGPPPDVNGSVASQWISHSSRPVHRPLANYGRRVDTIKWTRTRIKELTQKINKLRRRNRSGRGTAIPAAFIEFHTQLDAQCAHQALSHHRPSHMTPHIVGVRPSEIVWTSLRMSWLERIIREFTVQGSIAVLVIFWSIPCAIVGIVSNIKFVASKVPFLGWIIDLPAEVLGLLSGLVPALALSLLMSLVPWILRACARRAGVPTASKIELFTQNAYFVFQVIQVFLVTTLTSAVSAALTQILANPASARTLLSQNLPKASNFYVSYFILQGLALSATRIVHLGSLFRHQLMPNSKNPRLASTKWHRLRKIYWGGVYPVFTNMGVIAITYSCIAPIILGFAGIGLFIVYLTYRYNLMYVYDSEVDTRGLLYPTALKQTLTGLYMAEVCLFGLFGITSAYGPVVMMLLLLIFTALVHISLNAALSPLLYNLPRTLTVEEDHYRLLSGTGGLQRKAELSVQDVEVSGSGYDSDNIPDTEDIFDPSEAGEQTGTRAIEGGDRAMSTVSKMLTSKMKSKIQAPNYFLQRIDFWSSWISPDPYDSKPNFLIKWLHPEIYADYSILRQTVPVDFPDPIYPDDYVKTTFYSPSVTSPTPKLWIPKDKAGVSQQEVDHTGKVIQITDESAWLDGKGRVVVDFAAKSPVLIPRIIY